MALFEYGVNYEGDDNEVVIIDVHGYIDSTTSPELSRIIGQHIAQEKYKLIVNLKEVDYISSIGWGVFISNLKEVRENGGDLLLTNMCANVYNIFDLMELSSIVKSFDKVEKAVVHFLGVRKQTALKQKVVGAEASGTASKASGAAAASSQRVQPVQEEPRVAAPKPAAKIPRTPVNRPGKRPAPIELVLENKAHISVDEIHDTQEHLLEKHIVRVVLDKPFYSVRQITKALRLYKYGSVKKSRRKIKQELIKLGLENREDRYEFALRNRR